MDKCGEIGVKLAELWREFTTFVIFVHDTSERRTSSGWSRIPELDARSPQANPTPENVFGRGGRRADG